ncbi:MAG: hydrogenase maturation nickel metallochaperone HypA [Desulfohalobiaceae bacterium]
MHEMSIAQSLLDIIEQEMAKNQVHILEEVKVQVGELSSVVPSALEFAFQSLIQESQYPQARLILERIPVRLCCSKCGTSYEPELQQGLLLHRACPHCGQSQGQSILQGRELHIEHILAE